MVESKRKGESVLNKRIWVEIPQNPDVRSYIKKVPEVRHIIGMYSITELDMDLVNDQLRIVVFDYFENEYERFTAFVYYDAVGRGWRQGDSAGCHSEILSFGDAVLCAMKWLEVVAHEYSNIDEDAYAPKTKHGLRKHMLAYLGWWIQNHGDIITEYREAFYAILDKEALKV